MSSTDVFVELHDSVIESARFLGDVLQVGFGRVHVMPSAESEQGAWHRALMELEGLTPLLLPGLGELAGGSWSGRDDFSPWLSSAVRDAALELEYVDGARWTASVGIGRLELQQVV